MEHLLLMYFKDKPELLNAWHRYKPLALNFFLLGLICISILAKAETVRSFSLGIAAGIVIINIGQGVSSLQNNLGKKLPGGSK